LHEGCNLNSFATSNVRELFRTAYNDEGQAEKKFSSSCNIGKKPASYIVERRINPRKQIRLYTEKIDTILKNYKRNNNDKD